MTKSSFTNLVNTLFLFLLLCLLVLLALYALAGWHTRYNADDYCYDAQFIKQGLWYGQIDSYLKLMPYSSNRYSLTLFSGLAWALGGVRIMPLLPGTAILLWGLALFYAIRQGSNWFQLGLHPFAIAFAAAGLLFYTLLLAPNRYQILFWRSGMLPYLAPLVFNTFIVGRVFYHLKRQKISAPGYLELGFLAWIAAGFSETIFALQTGLWGLLFVVMLWQRKPFGRKAIISILAGTILGAALLLLNPTNNLRQSPFASPPPLPAVAFTSIEFAWDFFSTSVRGAPLPFLAVLGSGLLFGWFMLPETPFRWRKALALLLALAIVTGLLLVCIMAPTVWSMSSYPEDRGLLTGIYVLILFFFAVGVCSGMAGAALVRRFDFPVLKFAAGGLLALALGAYALHFAPSTYALVETYQDRAETWDERDARIQEARAAGQPRVIVPGINGIARIFELQPDETHWVNRCAQEYYDLEAIITTE